MLFTLYLITMRDFVENINLKKLLVENLVDNSSSVIVIVFSIVLAVQYNKANENMIVGQVQIQE